MKRRARTRNAAACALAFVVLGSAVVTGASCTDPVTEMIVVIDGDLSDLDSLNVKTERTNGEVLDERNPELGTRRRLPLTLGIQAEQTRAFVVRVSGSRGDQVVVSRALRATMVDRESRVLVVSLCSQCDGVPCEDTKQTCNVSGRCESVVEARTQRWTGTTPKHGCAGTAEDDGGGVVEVDAGTLPLPNGFHDIADPKNWSTFDLAKVNAGTVNYVGAAFDGQHVYFSPYGNGQGSLVVRYDTGQEFSAAASWSTFDLTGKSPDARGYASAAVFKAKSRSFLWLVPFTTGVAARYTIGQDFTAAASWETIDLKTLAATFGPAGYGGAVTNFSHVWFTNRNERSEFALYDHREPPEDGLPLTARWEKQTIQEVADAGAGIPSGGYYGGAFDQKNPGGRFFFAPYQKGSVPHGIAVMKRIGAGGALGWETFDLQSLCSKCAGYAGAVFAKDHVYYVPHVAAGGQGRHGNVVRHDTRKDFRDAKAWAKFDLAAEIDPVLKSFVGGVFDGEFVYFVPFLDNDPEYIVRFDTNALSLSDKRAWSRINVRSLVDKPVRFNGAAFDGKYVYLVPYDGGTVLRFDARATRDPAARSTGSFL